jgi:type I restriction enzyme R subunit
MFDDAEVIHAYTRADAIRDREGGGFPLARERVERAFAKLTAGRSFTKAQRAWLDRIREHLVLNLSIDREDFENAPNLYDPGGWAPANRAFDGKLTELLNEINAALAA